MRFFNRRIHKAVSELDTVEISEQDGVRYLHLGNDTVQSAMRISAPNALELSYTQAMLGFLLFTSTPPERALLIGLGGGSLVKFLHHQLADIHLTVAEINAKVINAAHQFFQVPPPSERLEITLADATEFIINQTDHDCILLDGFDSGCQVSSLATESFYSDCKNALTDDGVLSVNFWASDPQFDIYRRRLADVFDQQIIYLPVEKRGNIIAFAFASPPRYQTLRTLQQRALQLTTQLGLPYTDFLERMRLHPNNAKLIP
ncbi:MAG: spermidine synthase [Sulfuriferula sp.]